MSRERFPDHQEHRSMTRISRIAFASGLAFCTFASLHGGSAGASETRRLCDQRVTYDVKPPVDVPANLSILSGVWKGTIIMAGRAEMCVSMVVKDVQPDGKVILLMTWNTAMGGREDINNVVGMGEALNWQNQVENGQLTIDGHNKYHGTHYYYVMNVPTAANPDVMEGSWMTDTHPQPIVLYREARR
jgi:hypothetical protein